MEGRELRRSVTLLEQLAVVDSYNLGELLKVRDEDEVRPSPAVVAACEKREASSDVGRAGGGRTLLDIMREEQPEPNGVVVVGGNSGNAINWKSFKERFRLRWAAAAASSGGRNSISYPELVVSVRPDPVLTRSVSVQNSQLPVSAAPSGRGTIVYTPAATDAAAAAMAATSPPEEHPSGDTGGEETTGGGESSDLGGAAAMPAPAEEQLPVRVSLMALLEQTDRQWGSGGASPAVPLAALDEEEEEAAAEDDAGSGIFYRCCVCMVRHKGAAFVPCGHTFCRLCSRELWVSRGSCPLCNGDILEILDIF